MRLIRTWTSLLLCLLLPVPAGSFCFDEAGTAYGINPLLLKGIAGVESGLQPAAINRNSNGSVDLGLMQINSSWLTTLGLSADDLLADPCTNVMAGAQILSGCLKRYGEQWEAVGCYNSSATRHRIRYSWKIYRQLEHLEKKSGRPLNGELSRKTALAAETPRKGYISVSVEERN